MSNATLSQHPAPNIGVIKARMKETWMAGDFAEIAKFSEGWEADFVARRRLRPGLRVLDVACGTGNSAIPAAKAGADVTGVDIATNLLQTARARAKREGLTVKFDEGDAEDLPYDDASFDLVMSMFGIIFCPRPDRAMAELTRVCRPGGQMVLANWKTGGFFDDAFKLQAKYLPSPEGAVSPMSWGDEEMIRQRFRNRVSDLRIVPMVADMKYPLSVAETVEHHRKYMGPAVMAWKALPPDKQTALRRDMENLFTRYNRATDGTTYVQAEYLEVSGTRN